MKRLTLIASMILGALAILAIPSSALATNDCGYATTGGNTAVAPTPQTVAGYTITVYTGPGRTGGATAAGACVDNGDSAAADFEGGSVEVGAGEDQGTGQGDEVVPGNSTINNPDAYAVVDGDNDNVDPGQTSPVGSQSDGYIGVSNWETSNTRTNSAQCSASGPDNGTAGSSNSGGCVGLKPNGPWVYVPGDAPTPVCGNTSGDSWNGSGTPMEGAGDRDGCQIP